MDLHFQLCKKTLVCDKCDKEFEDVESIEEHIDICNSKTKYKCSVCGKCFDNDASCVSHEGKCTKKKVQENSYVITAIRNLAIGNCY